MPEGPEIHRAASKIRKALEGNVIEDIEITVPQFSGRKADFLGKTVNKVEARGKVEAKARQGQRAKVEANAATRGY